MTSAHDPTLYRVHLMTRVFDGHEDKGFYEEDGLCHWIGNVTNGRLVKMFKWLREKKVVVWNAEVNRDEQLPF